MKYILVLAIITLPFYGRCQLTASDTVAITNPKLVDKEARFPGGAAGWQKYLEHNLNAGLAGKYIRVKRKEATAQQTAIVQFLVNKDGKIFDVKTINTTEIHPKLAKEAERVIKTGPDWIPAEQNGKKVLYQAIQHITFQVARE